MSMTPEQRIELDKPLIRAHIRRNPRGFDYVESWRAEDEANRIFGYDGWSSTILELKCVLEKERKLSSGDGWTVTYTCIVRVTALGETRDGAGAGHGLDRDLGLAHESALKEAASDAEKRALKTFGNQFGLALYDKDKEGVEGNPVQGRERQDATNYQPTGTTGSSGLRRLTSAQAKEKKLDLKVNGAIQACKTRLELAEWDREFDKHTAECPIAWLDSFRNEVVLQGEAIDAEQKNAAMDAEYEEVVR